MNIFHDLQDFPNNYTPRKDSYDIEEEEYYQMPTNNYYETKKYDILSTTPKKKESYFITIIKDICYIVRFIIGSALILAFILAALFIFDYIFLGGCSSYKDSDHYHYERFHP